MATERDNIPGTILIPRIPDAYITVSYIVPTTDRIFQIAEDVGAERRDDPWGEPCLTENHYPATEDESEHWILVVRWTTPGVHYSAQAASTRTPTLEPVA